jgi:hypothetical protein
MRFLGALYAGLRALAIAALTSVAIGGGAHGQSPTDPETAAWNRARQENTLESYQRYLELYPLGAHAAEAFQATVELMLSVEPSAPSDEALPGVDIY